MTESKISIIPFQDHHQAGIDALMASIAGEYEETFFLTIKIHERSCSFSRPALLGSLHRKYSCGNSRIMQARGQSYRIETTISASAIARKRCFYKKELSRD